MWLQSVPLSADTKTVSFSIQLDTPIVAPVFCHNERSTSNLLINVVEYRSIHHQQMGDEKV